MTDIGPSAFPWLTVLVAVIVVGCMVFTLGHAVWERWGRG